MILVTGSSGFIGHPLCAKLKSLGIMFDGLDIRPGEFTNIIEDVQAFKYKKKYDKVIHLAALKDARESISKREEYYSVIVLGTKNLLNQNSVGEFVFTSSVAAQDPMSPYSKFKLEAELLIKKSGIPYKIFRLANVYGPGSSSIIEKFAIVDKIEIYGQGDQVRDYIHVEDVVSKLIDSSIQANKLYYLGTGKAITVNQVASWYNKPIVYLPEAKGDIKFPIIKTDFPDIKNRLPETQS